MATEHGDCFHCANYFEITDGGMAVGQIAERQRQFRASRRQFLLGAAGSLLTVPTFSESGRAELVGCPQVIESYAPPPPVQFLSIGDRGRRLAFSQYGAQHGFAIIYMHGFPACRYEAQSLHWAAKRLNCRIIAPDRPGLGRSDCEPARTIATWACDVAALIQSLQIREFAIIGVSAGAPYALACLLRWSGVEGSRPLSSARLRSAALVSALAPLDAPGVEQGLGAEMLRDVDRWPCLAAMTFRRSERQLRRNPSRVIARQTAKMAHADRQLAAHPTAQRVLSEIYLETICRGTEGLRQEAALTSRSWELPLVRLCDLPLPVYLWHGCCDLNTPPSAAEYYQRLLQVPEHRIRMVTGGGHFTVPAYCAEAILRDLVT